LLFCHQWEELASTRGPFGRFYSGKEAGKPRWHRNRYGCGIISDKETWIGYKLHADVNDWGAPISEALTAASAHDGQVAIPLMKLSSDRVDYLYDLMNAAYDAKEIAAVSCSLGHVPTIDRNSRGREVIPPGPP
jgi:hypothetical protein